MITNSLRYIVIFFATAIFTIAGFVIFNLLVDPYDIFGMKKIIHFNAFKPVIASNQRVYETITLLKNKPEAIILGTSRSDIGLSPSNPLLPSNTFNVAMSGQQIWESRKLMQAALEKSTYKKPRIVLIGLDFFAFNNLVPMPFDYNVDNFDSNRPVKLLFSISTSLDALRTLIYQRKKNDFYVKGGILDESGFRIYGGNPALSQVNRFRGSENGYFRNVYRPAPECTWKSDAQEDKNDSFEEFRKILELAYKNHLDLKAFISPSHARQWEAIEVFGLWGKFEDWKRKIAKINQEEAIKWHQKEIDIWDFSGYNSITTEPVIGRVDNDKSYYWESSHYKKELGDLVIARIYNQQLTNQKIPNDFGFKINSQNIEDWLHRIRSNQLLYHRKQPEEHGDVFNIALEASKDGPCVNAFATGRVRLNNDKINL
jgi:hypothetical protein